MPIGPRHSSRSATVFCSRRAWSGWTRAPGSMPSWSPPLPTGRRQRSCWPRSSSPRRSPQSSRRGATRAESVRAALAEVPDDALVVIVHDAARPLVDDAVIERVLGPLAEGCDGVFRACRSPTPSSGSTAGSSSRPSIAPTLVAVQTPQAFTAAALRAAYRGTEPVDATDCASLVEAGGGRHSCRCRGCSPVEDHDRCRSRARRIVALRAVFFDVGETLVDEERWWRQLAERSGLQPHVRLGGPRCHDRARARSTTSSGVISGSSGRRRGGRSSTYELGDLYPDAIACLEASGRSGCASGSSGNQTTALEQWARDSALPADVISSSATLGVRKPDPRFFDHIVELAGCLPGEIAYVGDRVDNDVLPALAAGLAAIHVRRGPWGRLQTTPAAATLGVDDLAIAARGASLAHMSSLRIGLGSRRARFRSRSSARPRGGARSIIHAASPGIRTAT